MAGCYVGDGLNGWYWRSIVHATGCCVVVLLYCVVSCQCCFSPLQDVFPYGFFCRSFSVCYVLGQLLCLSVRCVCAVVVACTIDGNQC